MQRRFPDRKTHATASMHSSRNASVGFRMPDQFYPGADSLPPARPINPTEQQPAKVRSGFASGCATTKGRAGKVATGFARRAR